jgi:GTPase Era involved in 16S rRNA processing
VSLLNGVKLGLGRHEEAELDTTTFMISALENDGVVDLKNYLITLAKHKPWLKAGGDGNNDYDDDDEEEEYSDSETVDDTDNDVHADSKRAGITRSRRSNQRVSKGKMSYEKPLLDSAAFTTMSPQQIVEECILESLLEHTHEEIPYIAKIRCTDIKQVPGIEGRVSITCTIEVDTRSQARIVVGAGARTLVKIRQTACLPLEQMLGVKYVLLTLNVETRFDNKGKMKKSAVDDMNND